MMEEQAVKAVKAWLGLGVTLANSNDLLRQVIKDGIGGMLDNASLMDGPTHSLYPIIEPFFDQLSEGDLTT